MLVPQLVTPPAELPVSLEMAKEQAEIDFDDRDALIQAFIGAATAHLDGYSGILGRCLVSQEWRQDFACWGTLRLPFPDVSSVEVSYIDAAGVRQTIDTADYQIAAEPGGPVVRFVRRSYPAVFYDDVAPISVTFQAGYGTAEDVPWSLRVAILQHAAAMFEYRESLADRIEPTGVYEMLIAPYRWIRV
ncbi:phage head-tail connector protein [Aestuariibius insulae]|uniref:head-tail connector protein n=1 Tax=Aestuariibius insulae TaxID=2058287 RepID=UPI00345F01B8